MRVVITIEIDPDALDRYARDLYDGEEYGDPPPPDPGRDILDGWIAEARHSLQEGHLDTIWFTPDNPYVRAVTISIDPGRFPSGDFHRRLAMSE